VRTLHAPISWIKVFKDGKRTNRKTVTM